MNIAGCICSAGKAVTGERGELVCVRPFPSQPTHFWNDPDGAKYRKAYFEGFPGEIRTKDQSLYNMDNSNIHWVLVNRSFMELKIQ